MHALGTQLPTARLRGGAEMTPEVLEQIERAMHALEDHDLQKLVALERSAYQPEAVEIARQELRRRRLEALTAEQYWDLYPSERIGPDGFCVACSARTTSESPGGTFTFNLIGTRLLGSRDRCPACGSIAQRKWFCFLLPVIPLGRYRIIYLEHGHWSTRYVGRKLRHPSA